MKRLYVLCALIAGGLLALTAYYRSEPDTFYGIADARETVISSESAVEIRRIPVVQGQLVKRGDTLLEVHSPELELRLTQISHELAELRTRKSAHANLSRSELLQLKAQQEERASGIRAEIKELEAQYEMNRQLVSELRSLDREKAAAGDAGGQNPILVKLESLRRLLELAQDPSRVYETRLASALSSDGDPLSEQVSRLEDEQRLLLDMRKRLVFTAQIDGVIGSINFKVGEKVNSFNPILTLHSEAPSFVRGYIHEDVYSQVALGEKVRVQGIQSRSKPVDGLVVGVGTRIVEYPERLRKRADILIWGREVMVQLPERNRFLLGEKVLITLPKAGLKGAPPKIHPDETSVSTAPAEAAPSVDAALGAEAPAATVAAPKTPAPAAPASVAGLALGAVKAPAAAGVEIPGIEVSGLLWLEDIQRFLLISDDTKKKAPLAFLTDPGFQGLETAAVGGLDKMDDMEAVAAGPDGSLYLLSSQSPNSKGKLADHRKLLVKAKRKGRELSLEGKVLLLDALTRAAEAHPRTDWAAFLALGKTGGIDIEGMAVRGNDLFLGFKAPLLGGKAVILRLSGLDALLAGGEADGAGLSLWKALDLRGGQGATPCGIADLVFAGEDAYLLSTGTAGSSDPNADDGDQGGDRPHVGELWHLPAGADKARRLKDFGGEKPEGLAWLSGSRSLAVAFDNGSKRPSRLLKMEIPR